MSEIFQRKSLIPYYLLIFFTFILSRFILYTLGIHFNFSPINSYIQYLDPAELQNNLIQSIFYLHVQPPLFNIFLGIILKLFPSNYPTVFHIIYFCMGLLFSLSLFRLMIYLGIQKVLGFLLTILFIINPSTILYENWLFYSYPVALILLMSAIFFFKYIEIGSRKTGLTFFTLIGMLVLIRGTFHWLWFIGWLIFFILYKKSKNVLLMAAIPLILILALCFKNYILFQSFSTSSKTMLNLQWATMLFFKITPSQLDPMIEEETVSIMTAYEIGDIKETGKYIYQHQPINKRQIPVLDNFYKSTGSANFNSQYHLLATEQYQKDALAVFKRYPQNYLKTLLRAFTIYFFPGPTDVSFPNRSILQDYENSYHIAFQHLNKINNGKLYTVALREINHFGKLRWDHLSIILFSMVVVGYIILTMFGFFFSFQTWFTPAQRLTIIFILINIFYVTSINNMFSSFSNNRYRFEIDVFYVVLFGLLLNFLRKKIFRLNNH